MKIQDISLRTGVKPSTIGMIIKSWRDNGFNIISRIHLNGRNEKLSNDV